MMSQFKGEHIFTPSFSKKDIFQHYPLVYVLTSSSDQPPRGLFAPHFPTKMLSAVEV